VTFKITFSYNIKVLCYHHITMNMESPKYAFDKQKDDTLTNRFKSLERESLDLSTFTELETILKKSGFTEANKPDVVTILNDSSLFCRNESFGRLIELLENNTSLNLVNEENDANICTMSSGNGFRTAMVEGFAGKDVDYHIKTVISFNGDNLSQNDPVEKTNELWSFKPETAKFSRAAKGHIELNDIEMISCRYPIDFYPEDFMHDEEIEKMEEDDLNFIVRHYIKNKPHTD